MLGKAVRICDAKFGTLYLHEEGGFRLVAGHEVPEFIESRGSSPIQPAPGGGLDTAMRTKRTAHLPDLAATQSYAERHPRMVEAVELGGMRTVVAVPMLKDNDLVGVIAVFRREVRPFSDKQVALVENFAAQAVIAIENARLLNELRQSLEQQTATADVLQVISSSLGDLEPVFATMLEQAVRICEASVGSMVLRDGDMFRRVAIHGAPLEFVDFHESRPTLHVSDAFVLGQILRTKQVVQISDVQAEEPETPIAKYGGARTLLTVPLLKENEVIGALGIYRQEVRLFSDKQIALVENFAAQAVIAIENARLLNELRQRTTDLTESLDQQTATSEVLSVISRSPGELHLVFETILQNAVRICGAKFGNLWLREGDFLRIGATHGAPAEWSEFLRREPVCRVDPRLGRPARLIVQTDATGEIRRRHLEAVRRCDTGSGKLTTSPIVF
jgi:GAF domain-containing protein